MTGNDEPRGMPRRATVDYARINDVARPLLLSLVGRWLPDGRKQGHEWVARNPRRNDRDPGSFKVNLNTGRWSDFATDDRGGDPVSLAAYLFGLNQHEAAHKLAVMLGLEGCA